MKDKGSCIGRAAIILSIGSIVSKILGFVRELVVAYRFGAGSITDAFVLTNGIPTIIFVSVGTAIGINFIPCFQQIKSIEEQDRFTSNLMNILLAGLSIGCVLVIIFPKVILVLFATGLSEETERYAIMMLRIVMVSIIPITVSHLFQAYLQAKGAFVSTALYGVVMNSVIIAITLMCTSETYWLLSVGTVIANTSGMLIVLYDTKRVGFRYSRILDPKDEGIKALVLLTQPLLAENVASSVNLLVDRNMASFLDSGAISGLSYAGLIGNMAMTLIVTSVITASFPAFSKMLAEKRVDEFKNEYRKYAILLIIIMCPIAAAMMMFSKDIVRVIFEHGAFDEKATGIVCESMACYAIGIVPSAMQTYLIRCYYAMKDTKTPAKIKVFALGCNIFLNLVLVRAFKHMGIATATSISFVIAYALLAWVLIRKYEMNLVGKITTEMLRIMCVALFIGGVVRGLFLYVRVDNLLIRTFLELGLYAIIYIIILFITDRGKAMALVAHIIKK